MMRIDVRFFAVFRETAGTDRLKVETAAKTVSELFQEMMQTFDGLAHEPAALVAINDEMVPWDHLIADGDKVLFFPPVAGG